MVSAAIVLCTLLFVLTAHVVGVAGIARLAGVEVAVVRLFTGPRVWGTTVAGMPVELGALPLGSYVAFAERGDGTALDEAPRGTRLAIALVPWTLILLPAIGLLGPSRALEATLWGPLQFVGGGVVFWSYGVALVNQVTAAFATADPAVLGGLVIAKITALNLLPLPGLSGGQAIEALLPRPLPGGVRIAGALIPALCALGWPLAVALWALA